MAELAAIGLASNVLQFSDVAIKVFVRARRIHKSASGTTQDVDDFEVSVRALERTAESLKKSLHGYSASPQVSADEQDLATTAADCSDYAKIVVDLLGHMQVSSGSGLKRKWESFKVALSLNSRELEDHQRMIEKFQSRLILKLATVINNKQSATINAITRLREVNNDLQAHTIQRLDELSLEVTTILREQAPNTTSANIVERLNRLNEEAALVRKHQRVLKSLRFPSIRARFSAIKKEHEKTFEWVYCPEMCSFLPWLQENTDTYFICGKAGSGKSTLMKFLVEDERTQTALQTWTGQRTLIIASHYFWNSGNSLQKSQEGLIRTLLYQVLRQCPDLIPAVCASRWPSVLHDEPVLDDWTDVELLASLEILSRQTQISAKFALFIDGLDEYTGGADRYRGTYHELIGPLKQLAKSDSIKVCVSSRPWTEFELAFGHDNEFQLKLEDLTKSDVRRYVQDTLWSDSHFSEYAAEDERCSALIETITERAQGVFLWVFLVVRSLLRGLTASDDFEDLQRRLDELPVDLEDYFRHMLRTIEPVYWDDTVRLLQTTVYKRQALPIIAYDFLDQEKVHPNFALTLENRPDRIPRRNVSFMSRFKKRLNARCRDLLEVAYYPSERSLFEYTVDFLHRTVRDFFLGTNAMALVMRERQTADFHPILTLLRITLALSKVIIQYDDRDRGGRLMALTDDMLCYVHQVESGIVGATTLPAELKSKEDTIDLAHEVLDDLDRVMTDTLGASWLHTPDSRSDWPLTDYPRAGPCHHAPCTQYSRSSLLELAMESNVSLYAIKKLERIPQTILRRKQERPWLDWALRPRLSKTCGHWASSPWHDSKPTTNNVSFADRYTTSYTSDADAAVAMVPNKPLVLYLLEHGADPNERVASLPGAPPRTTVWAAFLSTYYEHVRGDTRCYSRSAREDLYEVMIGMIDKGADPTITIAPSFSSSCPSDREDKRRGGERNIVARNSDSPFSTIPTSLFPSSYSDKMDMGRGGDADIAGIEARTGVVDVARKLLNNKRQVEAIEAALRRQEDAQPAYLAEFIAWFRSRKP